MTVLVLGGSVSCHFHNAMFITSGKNHQKKKIMIVDVERLLERAAFLSKRMGRAAPHPRETNQKDTNIPQNMHRTLGEVASGSWGHLFLAMVEKAV